MWRAPTLASLSRSNIHTVFHPHGRQCLAVSTAEEFDITNSCITILDWTWKTVKLDMVNYEV